MSTARHPTLRPMSGPKANELWDGRYRLERQLGAGGMASVWLARDERLDREVALKLLSDVLAGDEEYLQRFEREARVAAGLNHANLVTIFDSAVADGRPYLVMELVSGGTVAQRIRDAGFTAAEVERLAEEMLAALAHIHEAGVVHRDLKPANVLIDDHERFRLTDFGIAQPGGRDVADADRQPDRDDEVHGPGGPGGAAGDRSLRPLLARGPAATTAAARRCRRSRRCSTRSHRRTPRTGRGRRARPPRWWGCPRLRPGVCRRRRRAARGGRSCSQLPVPSWPLPRSRWRSLSAAATRTRRSEERARLPRPPRMRRPHPPLSGSRSRNRSRRRRRNRSRPRPHATSSRSSKKAIDEQRKAAEKAAGKDKEAREAIKERLRGAEAGDRGAEEGLRQVGAGLSRASFPRRARLVGRGREALHGRRCARRGTRIRGSGCGRRPTTSAPRRATSRRRRRQPRRLRPRQRHADPRRDRRPRRPGRGRGRADRRARDRLRRGKTAIAIADIETQGMFAAYEDGPYGLDDIAQQVEQRTKGKLPADHILIASDHTHSGPDTIGAWGGVSNEYLQYIHDQTVDAIVAAFNSRRDGERPRRPLRRLRPDLQPVLHRGAQPGQGARRTRARGLRDARQGRDGPRRPGDRPEERLGDRHVHGLRRARDRRRRQRAARRLAAVPLGRDERRVRRRRPRDGGRARRHPALPPGVRVHRTRRTPATTIANRKKAIVLELHRARRERARAATPVSGPVDAAKGFIREPITGPAVLGALHGRQLRRRAPAALAPEPVGRRQHDPHGHVRAARRRRAVRRHAGRGLPRDRRRGSATRSPTSRRSSSSAWPTTSSAT